MEAQPWYPQVPPRDCKAGTVPPIPRIFLVPLQHPPPPALTPSVKKLLSMRRLGTRLGILLWESSPVSRGARQGGDGGAAWCPYRPYLRIFPSSLNVFSPSSHDLERSVVMASR